MQCSVISLTWLTADILNSSSNSATISLWRTTDPGNFASGKGLEMRICSRTPSISSLSGTSSREYLLVSTGRGQPIVLQWKKGKMKRWKENSVVGCGMVLWDEANKERDSRDVSQKDWIRSRVSKTMPFLSFSIPQGHAHAHAHTRPSYEVSPKTNN